MSWIWQRRDYGRGYQLTGSDLRASFPLNASGEWRGGCGVAFDVFISYSSDDKPIADAACAALESANIRCWIAPRDISPGRDYGESIIDAIEGAKIFVLILSGSANGS